MNWKSLTSVGNFQHRKLEIFKMQTTVLKFPTFVGNSQHYSIMMLQQFRKIYNTIFEDKKSKAKGERKQQ